MTTAKPTDAQNPNATEEEKKKRRRKQEQSRRQEDDNAGTAGELVADAVEIALDVAIHTPSRVPVKAPVFKSGKGGDFGGAGASGSFDDAAAPVAGAASKAPVPVVTPVIGSDSTADAAVQTAVDSVDGESALSGVVDTLSEAANSAGEVLSNIAEGAGSVLGGIVEGAGEILSGLDCTADASKDRMNKPARSTRAYERHFNI